MIKYIGGKFNYADWIFEYFPKSYNTYVEVFGGAFWIYLKNNIYANTIVYNDLNPYMVNMFECLSNYPIETYKKALKIKSWDYEYFNNVKDIIFKEQRELREKNKFEKNIDLAIAYAYISQLTHCGTLYKNVKFQKSRIGNYPNGFTAWISNIKKYQDKLKRINNTECLNYEQCIKKYDSENTFLYIDPPYYGTESYYVINTFIKDDHYNLAEILKKCKSKWLLSYYEFDGLYDIYPKEKYNYTYKTVWKANGFSTGNKNMGEEILISNFKNKKNTLFRKV